MIPSLPTRFYGTATLDGDPAPDGAEVEAFVQGNSSGKGKVAVSEGVARYVLDVVSATAKEGDPVMFSVGGNTADEEGVYRGGTFVPQNLTARSTAQGAPTGQSAASGSPSKGSTSKGGGAGEGGAAAGSE